MSNELSDWRGMHQAMGKALDGETAESWHKVHAQLLKSVADAQAKLLAGINEITDKLDKLSEYSTRNLEVAEKRINGRLASLEVLAQDAARNSFAAVDMLLAKPRRPVERLRTKRIVKAAKQRR